MTLLISCPGAWQRRCLPLVSLRTWSVRRRLQHMSAGTGSGACGRMLKAQRTTSRPCIWSRDTPRCYSRYVVGEIPLHLRREPPWKVLFFGTDTFSTKHLQALNENRIGGDPKVVQALEVVANPQASPVRAYANENGLHVHDWPIPATEDVYDVGVVASFGHLIPNRIIHMFPYGILNVHPSLLPRWRGASPIIHTVLNGDLETGVSVMEIRPRHFDIGPILLQERCAVPEGCTSLQLADYLAPKGGRLLLSALRDLPRLERLEHEQDPRGVTYAHKIHTKMARVNWQEQTCEDIDRQYRAMAELFSLRSEWKGQHVRLLDMVMPGTMRENDVVETLQANFPEFDLVPPGLPFFLKKHRILCIRCQDGWAGFRGVVVKKKVTAAAFHNGHLSKHRSENEVFTSLPNLLDKYTFHTRVTRIRDTGYG